jgi:hypothetical protein
MFLVANRLHVIPSCLPDQALISYARTVKQLEATAAEMWTISYYGAARKGVLTRSDLDAYFGCPVVANVETATTTYRAALQTILTGAAPAQQAAA